MLYRSSGPPVWSTGLQNRPARVRPAPGMQPNSPGAPGGAKIQHQAGEPLARPAAAVPPPGGPSLPSPSAPGNLEPAGQLVVPEGSQGAGPGRGCIRHMRAAASQDAMTGPQYREGRVHPRWRRQLSSHHTQPGAWRGGGRKEARSAKNRRGRQSAGMAAGTGPEPAGPVRDRSRGRGGCPVPRGDVRRAGPPGGSVFAGRGGVADIPRLDRRPAIEPPD